MPAATNCLVCQGNTEHTGGQRYTYVAMADGDGCSFWGRFLEPGPYWPINEPSSVKRSENEK